MGCGSASTDNIQRNSKPLAHELKELDEEDAVNNKGNNNNLGDYSNLPSALHSFYPNMTELHQKIPNVSSDGTIISLEDCSEVYINTQRKKLVVIGPDGNLLYTSNTESNFKSIRTTKKPIMVDPQGFILDIGDCHEIIIDTNIINVMLTELNGNILDYGDQSNSDQIKHVNIILSKNDPFNLNKRLDLNVIDLGESPNIDDEGFPSIVQSHTVTIRLTKY